MAQQRIIRSKAPTRMDLAGGTVDIWPLYLFLKQATTLNLGIDLFAETTLEETLPANVSDQGKVTLFSNDQQASLEFKFSSLEQDGVDGVSAPPSLILHQKLLHLFYAKRKASGIHDPRTSLKLSTAAKSPAGAGLGGSSTLSVSMIGALASWAGSKIDQTTEIKTENEGERWIDIVRDVETTVIQVPAGLQDYYGAMFGGLQSLKWKPGRHEREHLPANLMGELEKRLLLFYSGQSRNSGINNWALFKSFIDKEGSVRSQFEQIAAATVSLEKAIRAQDWSGASDAIKAEWEVRRGIAKGISTTEMDYAFSIAEKLGAPSGKVCGAGGGGCFFVYIPSGDPEVKERIQKEISAQGIRHLPFHASPKGLDVSVTHADRAQS